MSDYHKHQKPRAVVRPGPSPDLHDHDDDHDDDHDHADDHDHHQGMFVEGEGELEVSKMLELMKKESGRFLAYRTDGIRYWIEPGLPWKGERGQKLDEHTHAHYGWGRAPFTRESLLNRAASLDSLRASMRKNGFDSSKPVVLGVVQYTIQEPDGTVVRKLDTARPKNVVDGWSRVVIAHELGIDKIPYTVSVSSKTSVLDRERMASKIPEGL